MSALVYEWVHDNLSRLKLTTIESLLDNSLEIAAKEERSTLEVLDYLLAQEVKNKEDRAIEFRMRLAAFPMEKRLEDFDISFQASLDPAVIPGSRLVTVHPPCGECRLPGASGSREDASGSCSRPRDSDAGVPGLLCERILSH